MSNESRKLTEAEAHFMEALDKLVALARTYGGLSAAAVTGALISVAATTSADHFRLSAEVSGQMAVAAVDAMATVVSAKVGS